MKFSKDQQCWIHWLFEANKRFSLSILNYIVTSNHIHLLVVDSGKDIIPKSIQLIAGRTAQEYNLRKRRKGAFWEDRYHTTAIQIDQYLIRCLVYIDIKYAKGRCRNHPSEWPYGGYNEIQNPRQRYSLIDHKTLMEMIGAFDKGNLGFALDIGHYQKTLLRSTTNPFKTFTSILSASE